MAAEMAAEILHADDLTVRISFALTLREWKELANDLEETAKAQGKEWPAGPAAEILAQLGQVHSQVRARIPILNPSRPAS